MLNKEEAGRGKHQKRRFNRDPSERIEVERRAGRLIVDLVAGRPSRVARQFSQGDIEASTGEDDECSYVCSTMYECMDACMYVCMYIRAGQSEHDGYVRNYQVGKVRIDTGS